MNNRKYCCYRHFKQGKHQHSCTHCFTHVPMGVINPTHNSPNIFSNNEIPPLQISTKPFRIENRTHDYNEVQNKQSIAKRLRQPRIYVQKIISKFDRSQPLLPIKHTGSNQYEIAVKYFRKIGQCLTQRSKKQLNDRIKSFCISKNIPYTSAQKQKSSKENIFLTKTQFIEFIIENFNSFTHQQAQIFWNITFNQLRFKDRISMQAFVFNFGKFYLQLQNYNNTFSQAALRQRVIDLRVLLFDWFHNQVCIKYNMSKIQSKVEKIQKQLKFCQREEIYCDFHYLIEQCKRTHIKLRFLAETFFILTDNKFLNASKLKHSIQQKIEQRSKRIKTSRQILKKFFQINDYTENEKFPVTNIIQFCKLQNCNQKTFMDMVSWIQGLFQYLYFQRIIGSEDPQQLDQYKGLGLTLNFQSGKLQCVNILHIDAALIKDYDIFLQNLYNQQVQICQNFTAIIGSTFERIPHLEGHKKNVVQCNYVAETLLRFIRSDDLSCFWYVKQVYQNNRQGQNWQVIKQILKLKPREDQIKKNMKGLFAFSSKIRKNYDQNGSMHIKTQQQQESKMTKIIRQYQKISEEKLILKIKPNILEIKQQNPADNVLKMLTPSLNNIKNDQNLLLYETSCLSHDHFSCHCKSKYWIQTSEEVNSTISTIQSLESRLFSLLKLDM